LYYSSTSTETKSTSAASETQVSGDTSSSAAAADSGSDAVLSWQLEVFGSWQTLSDTESAQVEKAYCDPNNDTLSTSVVVSLPSLLLVGCSSGLVATSLTDE